MPTYEYFCEDCGDFSALRPMSARNEPCACPHCGTAAYRVMLSAPTLATMDGATRSAHATNERAANAPMTSAEYAARHKHGPGCGCCSGKPSKSTVRAADGSKAFPTKRPWMISH
jgi:putative FmdB family regulatory protein